MISNINAVKRQTKYLAIFLAGRKKTAPLIMNLLLWIKQCYRTDEAAVKVYLTVTRPAIMNYCTCIGGFITIVKSVCGYRMQNRQATRYIRKYPKENCWAIVLQFIPISYSSNIVG